MNQYSYSQVKKYLQCPTAFNYHYNHDVKPTSANANMDIGTLVHYGIQHFYMVKENAIDFALDAVKDKAQSYPPDVRETALEMCRFYLPHILELKLTPLYLEFKFNVELPNGVKFQGYVDFIGYNDVGELLIIDWKTRATNYTNDIVQASGQLYIYAYILREYLKMPVKRAYMVQLNRSLPSPLTLTRKGKPSLQMGKTTEAYFTDECTRHNLNADEHLETFYNKGKIVPLKNFMELTEVDLRHIEAFWLDFYQAIEDIERKRKNAERYPRLADEFGCKSCMYLPLCNGTTTLDEIKKEPEDTLQAYEDYVLKLVLDKIKSV